MAAKGTTAHCASEETAEDGEEKRISRKTETGITEINRQGDYLVENQALRHGFSKKFTRSWEKTSELSV